jgi:hypothetical protein
MTARMPVGRTCAQRGRERPSGVRRQDTCRVSEGVAHAPAALWRFIANNERGLGRQTTPPVIVDCKCCGHRRIGRPLLSPRVGDFAPRPRMPIRRKGGNTPPNQRSPLRSPSSTPTTRDYEVRPARVHQRRGRPNSPTVPWDGGRLEAVARSLVAISGEVDGWGSSPS